jgi:hypothetical protein
MEIKYYSERNPGDGEWGVVGTFLNFQIREEDVSDDECYQTSWSVKILGEWVEVNTFNTGKVFYSEEAIERIVRHLTKSLSNERQSKVELLNLIKQRWEYDNDKVPDTATDQ